MRKLSVMLLLLTITVSPLITSHAAEPIAAFTPGARILFQGDSITDGNRGRSADPNHILGHGYVFIIAAKHGAAFPDLKLEFLNRGVSGNTVLELEKRWQKDTLDLKPDVLSILIGVNDEGRGIPLDQYEQVYEKLISQAKSANPKLKLVLCAPFVKPTGKISEGIRKRHIGGVFDCGQGQGFALGVVSNGQQFNAVHSHDGQASIVDL